MKIRVSKVKEDKGELRGLLLSFLLLLAAVVAFGTGSLGFLNRTGERSQETLRKAIARGCVQSVSYTHLPQKRALALQGQAKESPPRQLHY